MSNTELWCAAFTKGPLSPRHWPDHPHDKCCLLAILEPRQESGPPALGSLPAWSGSPITHFQHRDRAQGWGGRELSLHGACHEAGCGHAHALWIFLWAEAGKGAFLFSPTTPEVNEFRLIFWILKRNFSVCNYCFYLAIIYAKPWVGCGRRRRKE